MVKKKLQVGLLSKSRACYFDKCVVYLRYMRKQKTSFALSPVALQLLRDLAKHLGISQAAILEMAIRDVAKIQEVQIQSQQGDQQSNGKNRRHLSQD